MEEMLENDSLLNEIKFDGIRFWLRDEPLGRISKEHQWQSPLSREVMVTHKQMFLKRIMDAVE